jgi:type IV secretory pathway VirB2 component (pilin)
MTALRDSNGTFLGLIAVALLILVAVRALEPRILVLAGLLLAVAVTGAVSAGMGKRWQEPIQNVITIRLFNSPERLASLYHSGLPLTLDQVGQVQGRCVSPTALQACAHLTDPAFYDWIEKHGREAYVHEMTKTPATTAWEPLAHVRESIGTRVRVDLATGIHEDAPVSGGLEKVFEVRNPALAIGWAIALLVVMLFAAWRYRRRGVYVIAAALLLAAYPHLWLVWVGDAEEVTRHSLLATVQLHLGLWLGTVWLLDAFLTREPTPG